jgi:nucleoid-associated protein YgaU
MNIEALYDRGIIVNYPEGDQALYRTPIFYVPSVRDQYHTIAEGQNLLFISQKYYGTQELWYYIADANSLISDIFNLPLNETIVIPNINVIQSMYG